MESKGRTTVLLVMTAASLLFAATANAEYIAQRFEVSASGGAKALNQTDTAFPEAMVAIPVVGAATYHVTRIWAVEGEFSWLIPVSQEVDLGVSGKQDRESPDILTYQVNVLAKLPLQASRFTPYLSAGLGAMTFLSSDDPETLPALAEDETAFAINFGVGGSFALGSAWALRADFREFAAFPSEDAVGLSQSGEADPIWMERGTVGLAYRF